MKIVHLQNNQNYKDKLYQYILDVDSDFNPVLSSKVDLKEYTERIVSKANIFCALTDNDDIIGVVVVYANDFDKQYAYIPLVSVSSAHRRQGIARKLMEYTLSFIKSLNGKISVVGIHTYNRYAFDLYVKLGFKNISETDKRSYLEYTIE